MYRRSSLSALRWVSVILIFLAVVLTILQLILFGRIRGNYPAGLTIGSIPVGGLDRAGAAQLLLQTYAVPIEIHYMDAVIQVKPSIVGFELDLESMLSAADLQRTNRPFWVAFWDYLWNRTPTTTDVPLLAKMSEDRLRAFLKEEVAARYDRPPSATIPVAGTVNFQSGESGTVLDVDRAVTMMEDAMKSPSGRVVNLSLKKTNPPRPSMQNLKILLEQILKDEGYDGLAELYLLDLQTSEELSLAFDQGQEIQPGAAFTAASTIKIPVMVSIFRRVSDPVPQDIWTLMEQMITLSSNESTDAAAMAAIDRNLAPLRVSEDMKTLGLQNTFWAGFFYPGAQLLAQYPTPANQRTDVFTDPDIFDQTTAEDMGILLSDIYECAQNGGGALIAAFPGEITQSECSEMVALLTGNHIGVLLQAGLPEGTQFAHKHGWVIDPGDGVMHNISNAGIAYTPGGNYLVTVYLYHPNQLVFEPMNVLVAHLSTAIYNYFNYSPGQ